MCFRCDYCNYTTNIKCNFNKHLKTKKHLKIIQKYKENGTEDEKSINLPPKPSKTLQFTHKSLQNPPIPSKFECKYCHTQFSRKDNLNRHLNTRCKFKNGFELDQEYKELFENQKKENDMYKEETKTTINKLYHQIDKLIEKVGNTHITQTNIVLNSYGKEDLSHITDKFKTSLLKIPYNMIPKLIEKIHFDMNKPENNNIIIPNKKEPYMKVFNIDKWVYKDRKETIKSLVENKYSILEEHYEKTGCNVLDTVQNNRYKDFLDKKNDGKLEDQLNKDTDLLILNCTKNN
jgi:hypothetical protein